MYFDEIARLVGSQVPHETRYLATQALTLILTLGAGVGVLLDPATQLAVQEAWAGCRSNTASATWSASGCDSAA